jgi:hypothetical protein
MLARWWIAMDLLPISSLALQVRLLCADWRRIGAEWMQRNAAWPRCRDDLLAASSTRLGVTNVGFASGYYSVPCKVRERQASVWSSHTAGGLQERSSRLDGSSNNILLDLNPSLHLPELSCEARGIEN